MMGRFNLYVTKWTQESNRTASIYAQCTCNLEAKRAFNVYCGSLNSQFTVTASRGYICPKLHTKFSARFCHTFLLSFISPTAKRGAYSPNCKQKLFLSFVTPARRVEHDTNRRRWRQADRQEVGRSGGANNFTNANVYLSIFVAAATTHSLRMPRRAFGVRPRSQKFIGGVYLKPARVLFNSHLHEIHVSKYTKSYLGARRKGPCSTEALHCWRMIFAIQPRVELLSPPLTATEIRFRRG